MKWPWRKSVHDKHVEAHNSFRQHTAPVSISGLDAILKDSYVSPMSKLLTSESLHSLWWQTVERYETELYVEYEGGVFVNDDGECVPCLNPVAKSRQVPVYAKPAKRVPVIVDKYCPPGTIYGIDPSAIMHEPWVLS